MSAKICLTNKCYYSLLVNSSDSYADCWPPFFLLLNKYWDLCHAKVYLNTQSKTFRHDAFPNLTSTCAETRAGRTLTWSECLLSALDSIDTPLVLYMQEDYFVSRLVLGDRIDVAATYMMDHPEIGHIGLTKHGSRGPFSKSKYDDLLLINKKAKYRISTQAGLWRVETLKSYLEASENGWMFEIFGTWRSHRRNDVFLTVPFDVASGGPCIDYLHTGIVKGKWLPGIQEVFQQNGIEVDYDRRGFYTEKSWPIRKLETGRYLLRRPIYMLRQLFGI